LREHKRRAAHLTTLFDNGHGDAGGRAVGRSPCAGQERLRHVAEEIAEIESGVAQDGAARDM
jgi:hypothetical protein